MDSNQPSLYRYMGRKEFFGSLLWDRNSFRLFSFDHIATAIFESLKEYPPDMVRRAFAEHISSDDLDDFINIWKEEGVMGEEGDFQGEFMPDRSQPDFISAPLRVYLDITWACNLKCPHCVTSSGTALKGELSTDDMKKVIYAMADAGVCEVVVGGGEPLFRKDCFQLFSSIVESGMALTLFTNGVLINGKMAKKLAKIPFRSIYVSLDGGDEGCHDYIRGKGSFKKTLKGVHNLSAYTNHKVYLQYTIMKHNAGDIEPALKLAHDLPVYGMAFSFVRPSGRAVLNEELVLTNKEFNIILNKLFNLRETAEKEVQIKAFGQGEEGEDSGRLYKGFGCGGGRVNCTVDPYGNLYPCNFIQYPGERDNILEKGLLHIWVNNPLFQKLRNLNGNEKCLNCKYFEHCRGGCRGEGLNCGGSLDAPGYYCLKEDESQTV